MEVLNFIFTDLDSAAAKLPLSYTGTDIGRATKTSALALKARIALYNSKWDIAAAASKSVMDLGYHSLYPSYRNLFMYAGENSRESIFAFDYKLTIRTTATPQNNQARNSSGFPALCLQGHWQTVMNVPMDRQLISLHYIQLLILLKTGIPGCVKPCWVMEIPGLVLVGLPST